MEYATLTTEPVSPSFWKRFVDDVIYAVSENKIVVILQHFNSIEPSTSLMRSCPFWIFVFKELLLGNWKLLFIVTNSC